MGHLVHIASIVGVVACVHHFWPKGVTYGEREDWEKAYRRRHYIRRSENHAQGWYDDGESSKSRESSRRDGERQTRRRDRDRDSKNDSDVSVRGRDIEYGARPVYSRHASRGRHSHEYEYERGYEGGDEDRAPAYSSTRASVRY